MRISLDYSPLEADGCCKLIFRYFWVKTRTFPEKKFEYLKIGLETVLGYAGAESIRVWRYWRSPAQANFSLNDLWRRQCMHSTLTEWGALQRNLRKKCNPATIDPKPQWNIDNLYPPRWNLKCAWSGNQSDFRMSDFNPDQILHFWLAGMHLDRFYGKPSAPR